MLTQSHASYPLPTTLATQIDIILRYFIIFRNRLGTTVVWWVFFDRKLVVLLDVKGTT